MFCNSYTAHSRFICRSPRFLRFICSYSMFGSSCSHLIRGTSAIVGFPCAGFGWVYSWLLLFPDEYAKTWEDLRDQYGWSQHTPRLPRGSTMELLNNVVLVVCFYNIKCTRKYFQIPILQHKKTALNVWKFYSHW